TRRANAELELGGLVLPSVGETYSGDPATTHYSLTVICVLCYVASRCVVFYGAIPFSLQIAGGQAQPLSKARDPFVCLDGIACERNGVFIHGYSASPIFYNIKKL